MTHAAQARCWGPCHHSLQYYAVISLDGDEMGKWLSGENAPTIGQNHAQKVTESHEYISDWEPAVGGVKRFVSPSFHKAISAALADTA